MYFLTKIGLFLKKCEIVVEGFLKVFGFGFWLRFWLEIILVIETS